jgi:hypothetical protein
MSVPREAGRPPIDPDDIEDEIARQEEGIDDDEVNCSLELQNFTLDSVKGKEVYRCKHCFHVFSRNTSTTRLR